MISRGKGWVFWRQGQCGKVGLCGGGGGGGGLPKPLDLKLAPFPLHFLPRLVSAGLETSEVGPRISHRCNTEVGLAPLGVSERLARVQKSFLGW